MIVRKTRILYPIYFNALRVIRMKSTKPDMQDRNSEPDVLDYLRTSIIGSRCGAVPFTRMRHSYMPSGSDGLGFHWKVCPPGDNSPEKRWVTSVPRRLRMEISARPEASGVKEMMVD